MSSGESHPHSSSHVRCSFCSKLRNDVDKIIAGPGTYICNYCVELCVEILGNDALAHDADCPDPQLPSWETMSTDDTLAHLPKIAAVADQVETSLRSWVMHARSKGATWAAIGQSLGMTRQSAWGRFSDDD